MNIHVQLLEEKNNCKKRRENDTYKQWSFMFTNFTDQNFPESK